MGKSVHFPTTPLRLWHQAEVGARFGHCSLGGRGFRYQAMAFLPYEGRLYPMPLMISTRSGKIGSTFTHSMPRLSSVAIAHPSSTSASGMASSRKTLGTIY